MRQLLHNTPRHLPGEIGIWILIFGDMMVFALMFLTFMYSRRDSLALYQEAQSHLNQSLGLVNTLLLLSSSWLVALSVQAVRHKHRARALLGLSLAFGCGIAFVICKGIEYTEKIRTGIAITTNEFFTYYFMFTGIHLLHVLIGLGVLSFMMNIAWSGHFTESNLSHTESGASFWHLVDLLWIALFAILYLIK